MRTGGRVKYFFEPADVNELAAVLEYISERGMLFFVLGGGTNVIAPGKIETPAIISTKRILGFDIQGGRIAAACGEPLPRLAIKTARMGYSGLEALAGIPGTVGGAVAMNAGGKWGCICDAVAAVTAVDLCGRIRTFERNELEFKYRRGPVPRRIITAVEFDLKHVGKKAFVDFRAHLREKAAAQPLGDPSAGCVFLNPPGASAGKLIDEAGLKGLAVGGARVSEKHANFIVTDGAASPSDVMMLMRLVTMKVRGRFGVTLKPEVKIVA